MGLQPLVCSGPGMWSVSPYPLEATIHVYNLYAFGAEGLRSLGPGSIVYSGL